MYEVRRCEASQAAAVSELIRRSLKAVGSRDYPADVIAALSGRYRPEEVLSIADQGHLYVAVDKKGTVVGCGAVKPFCGRPGHAYVCAVFTDPDCMGRGVGSAVMARLEEDPIFREANMVELHASVTARRFYEARGYRHKDGAARLVNGCYTMVAPQKRD